MSSGRFGKADLAAAVDTNIYTAPAGKVATATVAFCNRTNAAVQVRLAVRNAADALANTDYLEYDASVPAGGVLERTQIVLSPAEAITVRASAAGVSVRAHGFEEDL